MTHETGHTQSISTHDFESIIGSQPIVFIDFWAAWCVPCTQFSKIFEAVAKQYDRSNICFGMVDVEKESQLSELFEIRSVPHLMVFKDGIAIYSESGVLPESALKELVEQALVADVTDIKAQLEAKD